MTTRILFLLVLGLAPALFGAVGTQPPGSGGGGSSSLPSYAVTNNDTKNVTIIGDLTTLGVLTSPTAHFTDIVSCDTNIETHGNFTMDIASTVATIPNLKLNPGSGNATWFVPAASSVLVTNLQGLLHKASTSPVELNANAAAEFSITNRVTAATTLVYTNGADGQTFSVTMLGEASGGSARTITLVPQLGHLVANLDTFGSALATSFSFTLTNGNAAEISGRTRRLNGTNVLAVVTRQFAF